MRSADIATILRIPLLLVVLYSIYIKFNPIGVIILIVLLFASDAIDGYLVTEGKHGPLDFFSYMINEAQGGKKRQMQEVPAYGAYLDIAVDRIIEYGFWIFFAFFQIIPSLIVAIIFFRNTLADAMMVTRGKNFSKMQSAFGKIASSHFSRGAYAALKAINFGYLSLVYVSDWPLNFAYILTGIVLIFSLVRGAAEVYESL